MTRSVLVVDDEPNLVTALGFLLEEAGFAVRAAGDGEAALEEIRQQPPDLVVLDVVIPGRDGYDVCQTVRANPQWSEVRIVMISARARGVEREKGLAMGADDYLTKPFSGEDLLARIHRVLDGEGG